jgi:hypothetical protein
MGTPAIAMDGERSETSSFSRRSHGKWITPRSDDPERWPKHVKKCRSPRTSPKRDPRQLVIPAFAIEEAKLILTDQKMVGAHQLTKVTKILAMLPIPVHVRGFVSAIADVAHSHTCELRTRSYEHLGDVCQRTRRRAVDLGAEAEAYGILRIEPHTDRKGGNDYNTFAPQLPPLLVDLVNQLVANDRAAAPAPPAEAPVDSGEEPRAELVAPPPPPRASAPAPVEVLEDAPPPKMRRAPTPAPRDREARIAEVQARLTRERAEERAAEAHERQKRNPSLQVGGWRPAYEIKQEARELRAEAERIVDRGLDDPRVHARVAEGAIVEVLAVYPTVYQRLPCSSAKVAESFWRMACDQAPPLSLEHVLLGLADCGEKPGRTGQAAIDTAMRYAKRIKPDHAIPEPVRAVLARVALGLTATSALPP